MVDVSADNSGDLENKCRDSMELGGNYVCTANRKECKYISPTRVKAESGLPSGGVRTYFVCLDPEKHYRQKTYKPKK